MLILFLHGWQSIPGGVKPSYLAQHGHEIINPELPDEDFNEAIRIAQAEFDKHQPQVVVGSSRGGAVAMNINSGEAQLVLLCPAWKKWGMARTVKPGTVILHSRADDVVPFAHSEELAETSGATLIEVGTDHRLADPEPLAVMYAAVVLATPILCLGIDVAWWGGQRNKPESQRDTIAYTTLNAGLAADMTFHPVNLSAAANADADDPTQPNYDADGSVLGTVVSSIIKEHQGRCSRFLLTLDTPVEAAHRPNQPARIKAGKKGQKTGAERRQCERDLEAYKKGLLKKFAGTGWNASLKVQSGSPVSPRMRSLLRQAQLDGFSFWRKGCLAHDRQLIEIFPSEAIWNPYSKETPMMPDWNRVAAEHVRQACNLYDTGVAVPNRAARSAFLIANGKMYPAKFIRGLAYRLATGVDLDPNRDYSGGLETIRFFESLGFSTRHQATGEPATAMAADVPTITTAPVPDLKEHREPQKRALAKLLRERFGTVEVEAQFPWLVVPAQARMDSALTAIFNGLKETRGFNDFVTPGKSLRCDFFIPSERLIVECDERQHFTEQRAKALQLYPGDVPLDFDRDQWIAACRTIKAMDPTPPHRDEQRAFYDSLRDILAARNGLRLVRLRFGTDDWTAADVGERLDAVLGTASSAKSSYPAPSIQTSGKSSGNQVTKLALVSHDYNVTDSQGRYDYSEHFARISHLCDEQGCDTILYALYTWDRESTVSRSHDSFFGGLNHVQRIVLEVGQPAIESYDHVEVWQRGHAAPLVVKQRFARAGASSRCKSQFINDLPTRLVGGSLLVLCGESGIVSENRSGGFTDSFGFLGELDRLSVGVILNPIHDYMAKTHGVDMRDKRRLYSRSGRLVISVWNQGNGRDVNVPVPWTVYQDGEDGTDDVIEVPKPFDDRPDIRIGILDLTRLTGVPTKPVS